MNRYIIQDILENLSSIYLIDSEINIYKAYTKVTNSKIKQLQAQIDKLQLSKVHKRISITDKIDSLVFLNAKVSQSNQKKRNEIITKLKDLRAKTEPYHKKIKARNISIQIPSPDDIQGAYIDRPAQISALQTELDQINQTIKSLQTDYERYSQMSLFQYHYH